jgi:CRP-like cAMP-binding protein
MNLTDILKTIDAFAGLNDNEYAQIAEICTQKTYHRGEVITTQGEPGNSLYIVTQGFIEVVVSGSEGGASRVMVNLGTGQMAGEMALIDRGPRSATLRAASEPTIVQAISYRDFETLCDRNTRIGYLVMRNLATDLSFKLRHQNMMVL